MFDALRQRAATYAELCARRGGACCEADPATFSELHVQALWYDGELRPKQMTLANGALLEVLEPGRWNRGDGPDFQDALVMVDGLLRRGDVEVHLRPSDWDQHGHAGDPAYGNLILHVTWFPTPPAKTISASVPHLALQPFAEASAPFDFSKLDLFAATSAPSPGQEYPCFQRLREQPGETERLLASAGYYRLLTKTRRFIEGLRAEDPFQCLYEGLMAAMGYGRNAEPFRRLAQEVPFSRLREIPSLQRFAILAGVAGLLKPAQRDLWDLWWQSGFQPPLTPFAWDFRGMRPQNHPLRRLAGVVGVLHAIATLLDLPLGTLPEALCSASNLLQATVGSKTTLIGPSRANAIVSNLFVPYRLALGTLNPDRLNDLPGEDVSMPMREVWLRMTGSLKFLPKDGLRQQGLLQIYHDFCHNPRLVCATCPLG